MGKQQSQQHVDLTKSAHISDDEPPVPQLSVAIVRAQAGKDERYKTSVEKANRAADLGNPSRFRDNVVLILNHLRERLELGLDEAWASRFGYDGEPDPSNEEKWARMFAELVVYAAYGGPAGCYGTRSSDGGKDDMDIMRRLDKDERDPAYPIIIACQHLTTLCAMSRGIPHTEFGARGMTAGGNTRGLPLFRPRPDDATKRWYITSSGPGTETGSYRSIKYLISTCKLSPGSVFAFNSLGPDSGSQEKKAHIASVLRVYGDKFQSIDTGPLGDMGEQGTADHSATKGAMTALSGILVGVGIVHYTEPSNAQLDHLANARPLGFAQLVIADSSGTVRYISRVLPMSHSDKSFSISRYIWSVRNLPAANVQVYWILSIPRVKGVTKALMAPGARGKPARELLPDDLRYAPLENFLEPVHVIGSTPMRDGADAGPIIRRRKLDGAKNEWSGVSVGPGTKFPDILGKLKFAGAKEKTLYGHWRQMTVDSEYICADPRNANDPQVEDISAMVDYFCGPPRTPLPEEAMIAGKPGFVPLP